MNRKLKLCLLIIVFFLTVNSIKAEISKKIFLSGYYYTRYYKGDAFLLPGMAFAIEKNFSSNFSIEGGGFISRVARIYFQGKYHLINNEKYKIKLGIEPSILCGYAEAGGGCDLLFGPVIGFEYKNVEIQSVLHYGVTNYIIDNRKNDFTLSVGWKF